MDGYVGKILKVNLDNGTTSEIDTSNYVPDYIGGVGIAYRLVWENMDEDLTEFDPGNPLVFMTGPCSGTSLPSTGRTEISGLAPEGYPEPWVANSGFGGDFAAKLKYAGYDGVIIVGKAEEPVYLLISEDGVEVKDATHLWGLGTLKAQELLARNHSDDMGAALIGPAGENKVRWATVQARTENAAGQGGYGAVMGSKNLKAVVTIPGDTEITVADPEAVIEESKKISEELATPNQLEGELETEESQWTTRHQSCGFSACTGGFAGCLPVYYSNVPRKFTGSGTVSGVKYCVGNCGPWLYNGDWGDTNTALEVNKLCDDLSLNHWEAFAGLNWFLCNAYNEGELNELMGEELDMNEDAPHVYPDTTANVGFSKEFAVKFLRKIAHREGEDADILAEGTPRAAEEMGLEEIAKETHKHGYGPHWDGRYLHFIHYPVWVVSALAWAVQPRDPFNQQHGYPERLPSFVEEWAGDTNIMGTETLPYDTVVDLAAEVYGTENALTGWKNTELGYKDKEIPEIWHENRQLMKGSVPACDRQFPLIIDPREDDNIGDYEAELRMFNAVVGTDWSLEEMYEACEKIWNVYRSCHVLQGRTREQDETVIDYFKQPSDWPDEPQELDPDKFRDLLENYYEERGWDKENGWPTRDKLEELGLSDVADKLEEKGKLP
ncbi:MAG: Aldehyde:ferredoxin oxidoreductase [Candidatus Methanohalarchaeum thermophilum]|uniref:Aldehyde:ferredoxin oxidoreductase n=1 Tax=Methanohalarchaeum thermophilum TaxID=1903181 RepID=A0A1Q6DUF7_METT1|nr:MAG: Aldehyde:ferredoxin oxidoreductase [Candidatus Methanohalarchaeum thermophilum]